MEMMRQAWAGLTGPGGLASSLPMAPPMNVEDLERRIAELRSVENWLRMNLSMLSSTIQGMEVQRSTINTLRAFVDSAASMDLGALRDSGAASPLEVVLGLKPAPGKAKAAAPSGDAARDGGKGPAQDHAGDAAPAEAAAQDAAPPFAGMSEQMGAAAQSASRPGGTCCSNNSARSPPPPPRPCRPPRRQGGIRSRQTRAQGRQDRGQARRQGLGQPASKAAARAKPAARKAAPRRSRPPSAGPMISIATRNGSSGPLRFQHSRPLCSM